MKNMTMNNGFYEDIKDILQKARDTAYKQVNFIMVEAYWNIGKQIVEQEQNGEDRAKYGKYIIKELSTRLTKDFGKGYSVQNLWNMRQFYLTFPILSTLCRELSWSHYKLIMRVENIKAREYYINKAVKSNWSVRANDNLFVSKYQMYLPTEQELKDEIEKDLIELQMNQRG